jgi:hypothetical protein
MNTEVPFHVAGRHWLAPYSDSQSLSWVYFGASATVACCAFPNSAEQTCSVTACD